jgi:GNAT superfamily N-acetyltransferase
LKQDPKFIVKPLGGQNRAAFCCGIPELDKYILERASRDVREKVSAVFVLLREDNEEQVLGYYTLSSLYVDAGDLPLELRKKTGKYPQLGATLIGRLAIDKSVHGTGLGGILLFDALLRALEGSKTVMSYAIIVDAMNEKASGFYRKHGFIPLKGNRLFLPMKTLEKMPAVQALLSK